MHNILEKMNQLTESARQLLEQSVDVQSHLAALHTAVNPGSLDPWIVGLTVFILACFVGYYVVWRVTPALHSPLMAVTNAISSVIIVGAILAAGPSESSATSIGCFAVFLASINIFGGFVITQRMLDMFSKSKK